MSTFGDAAILAIVDARPAAARALAADLRNAIQSANSTAGLLPLESRGVKS